MGNLFGPKKPISENVIRYFVYQNPALLNYKISVKIIDNFLVSHF